MNLEIKLTQSDQELIDSIKIAIKYKLYVPGWSLRKYFNHALADPSGYTMALAYVDCVPVGVAFVRLDQDWGDHIVCFVKPAHRRKGIATALTNTVKNKCKNKTYALTGCLKSQVFWENVGI